MTLAMVMLVLQEKMFVRAVSGKSNASDTKAREEASEAVKTAEGAGVSPCFAVGHR